MDTVVATARPVPWSLETVATVCFNSTASRSALTPTEMSNMNQPSGGGPTAILNKCKELNEGIAELTTKRETQLAHAQKALLDSSTGKEDQASRQTLDYIEDEINTALRYLRDQFKRIKETPGSGDSRVSGQVENVSRNLRREIEQYQRTQSDFQKRLEEQVRRRYEIANPEATPEELEQGVQNVLMGQEQSFVVCPAGRISMITSNCQTGSRYPYPPGQRCPPGHSPAFRRHPQD
jgi:t-SNARE complex subunit (syntaxin)